MGEAIQKINVSKILEEKDIATEVSKQFTFNSATKVFFISGSTFNVEFNSLYL